MFTDERSQIKKEKNWILKLLFSCSIYKIMNLTVLKIHKKTLKLFDSNNAYMKKKYESVV